MEVVLMGVVTGVIVEGNVRCPLKCATEPARCQGSRMAIICKIVGV